MLRAIKNFCKNVISIMYYYSGIGFFAGKTLKLFFPDLKEILILAYHGVGDKTLNIEDNITLEKFVLQLEYLSNNFRFVSLDDAVAYLNDKKDTGKTPVLLTFDDAYASVPENVYPVIKEKNIPITLFIPVNYIGKKGNWHREEQCDGRIMDWDALIYLAKDPLITIGSHSMKHQRLSSMNPSEIKNELCDSKLILETKLGIKVEYFCYPYGQSKECSAAVIEEARKSGYKAACCGIFGRFCSSEDIFRLRRISVYHDDSFFEFKLKIKGGFDWLEIYHLFK